MSEGWQTILPERKLGPDREHAFVAADLAPHEPVTHVRLNILPDGGVMRLRLFGRIAP
jgi:allantoicase